MKKILICILFYTLVFALPLKAESAEDPTEFWLPPPLQNVMDEQSESVAALEGLSVTELLKNALTLVKDNMGAPLKAFAKISAILILAVLAQNFVTGGAAAGVGLSIETVSALAIFGVLAAPLLQLVGTITGVITSCENLIITFVPAFCTLVAASGYAVGAAAFAAFFMGGILLFSQGIGGFLLPFMQVYLAFSVVGSLNGTVNLGKIAVAMAKAAKWGLVLVATLFASVLTMQNMVTTASDTFALKAGKMVVSSAIPIVGKALSDAVGTVYAGLQLVRTGAGVAGILAILALFLPVLVQCILYIVSIYGMRTVAAVLGAGGSENMLTRLVECVQIYISLLVLYALLVIFAIVLLINVGGGVL